MWWIYVSFSVWRGLLIRMICKIHGHKENVDLNLALTVESRLKKPVVKLEAIGRICVHFLHAVQTCGKNFDCMFRCSCCNTFCLIQEVCGTLGINCRVTLRVLQTLLCNLSLNLQKMCNRVMSIYSGWRKDVCEKWTFNAVFKALHPSISFKNLRLVGVFPLLWD